MSYLGTKTASGAFQTIIAAMPAHDTYIETHLGAGAVMLNKPNCARSYGIDIDPGAPGMYACTGHCELVFGDCVAWLQGADLRHAGRVLVYADPPYVLTTRTSNKRYRHDYTDADHERLASCLTSLPANVAVMISGYPSALYDRLFAGWRTVEFQVMTRGGVRTEKLWMNYPADSAHWSTYAGRDRTDRQRIKRKAARWRRMFDALTPGERLAILAALIAPEAQSVASTVPGFEACADAHVCDGRRP
jgi:DNA adenine methylase